MKNYLFMSGEFRVTYPIAAKSNNWAHTSSVSELVFDNTLRRKSHFNESLKGVIAYADIDNKSIEKNNLELIVNNNIPCWPNPKVLLKMLDRHTVMQECINQGFVKHKVLQLTHKEAFEKLDFFPAVIKTGNAHRGIGKYLAPDRDYIRNFVSYEGVATIEPFFNGTAVRVLILGDKYFTIMVTNPNSWISNSPGGETKQFNMSNRGDQMLSQHAKRVAAHFGLDAAGVDYILSDNEKFNFLEINQYPGVDVSDEIEEWAKIFFAKKMMEIENV